MKKYVTLFLGLLLIIIPAACTGNSTSPVVTVTTTQSTSNPVTTTTITQSPVTTSVTVTATTTTPVTTSVTVTATTPSPVTTSVTVTATTTKPVTVTSTTTKSVTTSGIVSVEYGSDDLNPATGDSGAGTITLAGNAIKFQGTGASVKGSVITISAGGTYHIAGTLNDGQIIINNAYYTTVKLILEGVNITCSTSAPIYVVNSDKTVITLAEGTNNVITDGKTYTVAEGVTDGPNAAIFSHDDLTINGKGSLTVNANYNNGIQSKDDLKITGGNITVTAVNDGIKGRDSIAVKDGNITIKAGGDGMQADNDTDAEEGFVLIEGGTINITAGADGIQAETDLAVSGGNITLVTGGGSANSSTGIGSPGNTWGSWNTPKTTTNTPSAKGLKAGIDITVTGGTINIDSSDDAVNSNRTITIANGTIIMSSGDDGMHANTNIDINGGELNIKKSYEGIESSAVTINGGTIHLISSDDGINVVGGNDGSAVNGRPGQGMFDPSSPDNYLHVNGGYIYIDANGDGIDTNGPIKMTAGKVIINGPTANDNGALDYSIAFDMTGGYIIAVGSSGMAEAPSTTSTQYSVIMNLTTTQKANTLVHIETSDGQEILTFAPTKSYQSIVLCSPELKKGMTYAAYYGGSSTGTVTDGLYAGGKYTAGTKITTFTISGMVTQYGSMGMFWGW